jgi:hypothetical protein
MQKKVSGVRFQVSGLSRKADGLLLAGCRKAELKAQG